VSRARRLVAPALATLAALAILCSLGIWQVERLAWKEALIARVDQRLGAAPVPAPGPSAWAALDIAEAEYTPVRVTGTFDHAREFHLFISLGAPHGRFGGVGYLVFTPLMTADGWTVLVNRGFVPADRKDPATRAEGQVAGPVEVVGLLRQPERRQWYSASDDPARNLWYTRDLAAFVAALGLQPEQVAPYLIDAAAQPLPPGGLPQGGETVVQFPNNHLGYAITWFGLAAALLGVFVVYARRRLQGPKTPV
jgi:surfeit locus 1 family protein